MFQRNPAYEGCLPNQYRSTEQETQGAALQHREREPSSYAGFNGPTFGQDNVYEEVL